MARSKPNPRPRAGLWRKMDTPDADGGGAWLVYGPFLLEVFGTEWKVTFEDGIGGQGTICSGKSITKKLAKAAALEKVAEYCEGATRFARDGH